MKENVNKRNVHPNAHLIAQYRRDVDRHPLVTKEEEYALGMRVKTGDQDAFRKLVNANLRLVLKIAGEYAEMCPSADFMDLVQEGNIGLIQATQKFDPTKGRFSTYSVWWIRQSIQRQILFYSKSLLKFGTSQAQQKVFYNVAKAEQIVRNLHGHEDKEVVAEVLGISVQKLDEIRQHMRGEASLDEPIGEFGYTLLDELASDINVEEALIEREERENMASVVSKALAKLQENELSVITDRILIDDPLTLCEAGKKRSVTRERIRQIERKALAKLKKSLAPLAYEGVLPARRSNKRLVCA